VTAARNTSAVASSIGKNDSIESSETVTSVAVPNEVAVLMNESSCPSIFKRRGTAIAPTSRSGEKPGSPDG
jgi:hypothetical protein